MKRIVFVLLLNVFLVTDAKTIRPRLIGGIPAKEFEFPFQGSLLVNGRHLCGVILVTLKICLSAAFAISGIVKQRPVKKVVHVKLGCTDLDKCTAYPVIRISHHRDYQQAPGTPYYYNDISVIHMVKDVEVAPNLEPIPLPDEHAVVPDEMTVIVTGFGGQNKGETVSNWLLKIIVETEPIANCQQFYEKFYLTNDYICTVTRRRLGAGIGDAGDAMIDMDATVLYGISSGNNGGNANGNPNIFTKVVNYMEYIKEELNYFNSNNITLPNPPPAVLFAV